MKGVTTFLITVHKYDVPKLRKEIAQLGYVYTEHDWTPRMGCNGYKRHKRMIEKLQERLLWAFCSKSSNRAYLVE